MKYIEYTSEDGITEIYQLEEFIEESWYLPFEFVLSVANKNKELKKDLMNNLFLRATTQSYIKLIASNDYYRSLKNSIMHGKDLEMKIHLLLYFEPQLLHYLFKNVNNLVNIIINNSNEDTFLIDIGNKFLRISSLYYIDNNTLNSMIYFLENRAKNECIVMTNSCDDITENLVSMSSNEETKKNILELKDKYIYAICKSKLSHGKIKKLH